MFLFLEIFSILLSLSLVHMNMARADWSMGYTNPDPIVEEIPNTTEESADVLATAENDSLDQIRESEEQEKPPVRSSAVSHSVTKISTSRNTYGVETVEKSGLKLYLAPMAGLTSILGNATVNVAPQYAFGARAGLLLSDNLMAEVGYTYSLIGTSLPLDSWQMSSTNVLEMKQNSFDAGAKFFILGRESRVRPFVGGGLSYTRSNLDYAGTYAASAAAMGSSNNYVIGQFQGMGQLGAEIAITRQIVATAAFRINGVLSSTLSNAGNSSNPLDAGRSRAGSSLSQSASYGGAIGLGVYL